MYCHIHHCHYHQCNCVPIDSKEKGGALTQAELLALTQEMKQELKDYTVDLKDQIFSYIDVGLNPVEIANTFASLKEQDTFVLKTLTKKIDDLNNSSNLSMFNLRTRVTDLEGQSATIIKDLHERTLVVESVSELATIKNPKDGLRVFVKSYYAGLGKGSGWYIYDSSKVGSVSNLVVNGWVLQVDSIINATQVGVVADGKTDDTEALRRAISLSYGYRVVLPVGIMCISDTLVVGQRGKSLVGASEQLSNKSNVWAGSSTIKWIGGVQPRKAMVLLGNNEVGAEPVADGTSNVLKNVYLDGDKKVGFLVYGTYLTNNTLVENVSGQGSTEYNFYFARAWYATFRRIYSLECMNNGIAFGMPLVYSDGTRVTWDKGSAIEINQCTISDIRSHKAGQKFLVSGAPQWSPLTKRHEGYGIGAGAGHGFSMTDFLSEQSGGTNLLVWADYAIRKVIERGYLEAPNRGYQGSDLCNIFLDYSDAESNGTSGHAIKNVYCSYHGGGILTDRDVNNTATIYLENIYQPRFLKDVNGIYDLNNKKTPASWVMRKNCSSGIGYHNLTPSSVISTQENVNIRYGWTIELPELLPHQSFLVQFRPRAGFVPQGSYVLEDAAGESLGSRAIPDMPEGEWFNLLVNDSKVRKIKRGGGALEKGSFTDIRVLMLPSSTTSVL